VHASFKLRLLAFCRRPVPPNDYRDSSPRRRGKSESDGRPRHCGQSLYGPRVGIPRRSRTVVGPVAFGICAACCPGFRQFWMRYTVAAGSVRVGFNDVKMLVPRREPARKLNGFLRFSWSSPSTVFSSWRVGAGTIQITRTYLTECETPVTII